jgi:hypothetical protein
VGAKLCLLPHHCVSSALNQTFVSMPHAWPARERIGVCVCACVRVCVRASDRLGFVDVAGCRYVVIKREQQCVLLLHPTPLHWQRMRQRKRLVHTRMQRVYAIAQLHPPALLCEHTLILTLNSCSMSSVAHFTNSTTHSSSTQRE